MYICTYIYIHTRIAVVTSPWFCQMPFFARPRVHHSSGRSILRRYWTYVKKPQRATEAGSPYPDDQPIGLKTPRICELIQLRNIYIYIYIYM